MSCYVQDTCIIEGCNNLQHCIGKNKYGKTVYRKQCVSHHFSKYNIQGWEYKNHRKDYCENAKGKYKGWLGVPCKVTKMFTRFLTVDHLDGNHKNNDLDNLMTLCPTCHAVKTWIFSDHAKRYTKNQKI